jgi:ribokinase
MLTVFGSINLDIAVRAPRLPAAGETVLGSQAVVSPGGKGANQAHAARLFGAATRLVGAVGRDGFGPQALQSLQRAGVDLASVRTLDEVATGVAIIAVAENGENSIVVASGANRRVEAAWVTAQQLAATRMLLLQMEVPCAQSMRLARRAREAGCSVMLNAAPMAEPLAIEPDCIDWLVVNEAELSDLCVAWGCGDEGVAAQAAWLARQWQVQVVATRGAQGALGVDVDGRVLVCPALAGPVVDTTGAGDTFTGVLAAALAERARVDEALRLASVAAGLACRRPGAQVAQPTRAEIEAVLAA